MSIFAVSQNKCGIAKFNFIDNEVYFVYRNSF